MKIMSQVTALGLKRFTALYLAAMLVLITPLAHIQQARAEQPGVKKIMVVGLAAAGTLAALSFLTGPSKAAAAAMAASAAAAPTGILGGVASAFKGLVSGVGRVAGGLLRAVGLKSATGGATAAVKSAGLLSRWWVIPALIGAGLVAYWAYQKYFSPAAYVRDNATRYDRTAGRRYENPAYAAPVLGNRPGGFGTSPYPIGYGSPMGMGGAPGLGYGGGYGAGYGYGYGSPFGSPYGYPYLSLYDRFRMAITGGGTVPPPLATSGSLRGLGTLGGLGSAGGIGGFTGGVNFGGGAAFSLRSPSYTNGLGTAVLAGPSGISGTIFDIPGIGDPARLGATDRIGRGLTGNEQTLALNRESFRPAGEPETTGAPEARRAADRKAAAYERMVSELKSVAEGSGSARAVQQAVDAYRDAESALKDLTSSPGAR
jgi:hypothetical protein